MESGIVKNYMADRGFGFIKMEDRKDIFFHVKNGKNVTAGRSEPELSFRNARCAVDPKAGDRLMFELEQGQKGLTANPWCFAEDWKRVKKEIDSRPVSVDEPVSKKTETPFDIGQAHENKNGGPRYVGNKKRHDSFKEERQPTPYDRAKQKHS